MKKLFLIGLIVVGCLAFSSCEKDKEVAVETLSYQLNGKTITLTPNMTAKEVFDAVLKKEDEESWYYYLNTVAPFEYIEKSETKGEDEDSIISENILKTYSSLIKNDTNEALLFKGTQKLISTHSSEETTWNATYEFFGNKETLDEKDEGYENGDYLHYKENAYLVHSSDDGVVKKYSERTINSFEDLLSPVAVDYATGFEYYYNFFNPRQVLCRVDDSLSDFVSYDYELTNKKIVLKFKMDCSYFYYLIFHNVSDDRDIQEFLLERKKLGEKMEAEIHFDYNSLKEGDDILPASKAILEEIRFMSDAKVNSSVTFNVLDVSVEEALEIKNDIISRAKGN